ncbi:MAG: flagellar motor switch protein FliN [Candidatus Krumholzibacteria bacterium]|nr:flagellar motor switch protein FliN [Candidatus Krumholzibacteria bacterium]MDP6669854.1 flagellar motor switch protein FliN [Candidatus Krumholzibacteria bacterium]MDP6797081.1 flagellar motor switch protein FliN [Candidatus Krumholzibacteria bacterium]MDP7020943.1 flagellar motor switch protein FliN [Candidatus Krumholzibacteria bacterium]
MNQKNETESSVSTATETQDEKLETYDKNLGEKPDASFSRSGESGGLDMLSNVKLEMTVELGRARMNIGEVMQLSQGSVIELDKMAGEPVDLRVNGVLLAQGEVIVMDDVFGVRITRLAQKPEHAMPGL